MLLNYEAQLLTSGGFFMQPNWKQGGGNQVLILGSYCKANLNNNIEIVFIFM